LFVHPLPVEQNRDSLLARLFEQPSVSNRRKTSEGLVFMALNGVSQFGHFLWGEKGDS
jgi:hypothetical protein